MSYEKKYNFSAFAPMTTNSGFNGVDKNTVNVWKYLPQPRSETIVWGHWRIMWERSTLVVAGS
jgi:hypothetical protein